MHLRKVNDNTITSEEVVRSKLVAAGFSLVDTPQELNDLPTLWHLMHTSNLQNVKDVVNLYLAGEPWLLSMRTDEVNYSSVRRHILELVAKGAIVRQLLFLQTFLYFPQDQKSMLELLWFSLWHGNVDLTLHLVEAHKDLKSRVMELESCVMELKKSRAIKSQQQIF